MPTQYVVIKALDAVPWKRDISGPGLTEHTRVLAQLVFTGTEWRARFRSPKDDAEINFHVIPNCQEACAIIPIDSNHLAIAGHIAAAGANDTLTLWVFTFTDGGYTVTATKELRFDMHARFINSYGFDANGTLHLATFQALTGAPANSVAMNSAIIRITNTDLLAVRPTISDVTYSHYDINAITSFGGEVYFLGMERLNNKQFRKIIWKLPEEVVYRSERIYDLTTDSVNFSIRNVFTTPHGLVFITRSSLDDYDSVCLLDSKGRVKEIAAFLASPGETVANESVGMLWGVPHVFRRTDKKLYRTHHINGRGNLPVGGNFATLRLSEFGANTPLIPKTVFGITLELSEALPVGGELELRLNLTTVATMNDTHGLEKEFILGTPLTASSFKPEIRAARTLQWQGFIKRFSIRFIPNPLKKKAWSFAILAFNSMKLLNGKRESRSSLQIIDDIETAWRTNTSLPFTDVDGRTYQVMVTDYKGRQPLQNPKRDRREWIIPIELLEV